MHTERFDEPLIDNLQRSDRKLLPSDQRRPPWTYIHAATQWECVCTGGDPKNAEHWEWLPILGRIEGVEGANGVSYDKQTKRFNFSAAVTGHQSRGATAIQAEDSRLGKWTRYNARFFPTDGGGKRYVEPGERPTLLSNGTVVTRVDAAEMLAFRRHLKSSGLVEPMQAEVYDLIFTPQIDQRISRAQKGNKAHALAEAQHTKACQAAAWSKESGRASEIEIEAAIEDGPEEIEAAPALENKPSAKRQPRGKAEA